MNKLTIGIISAVTAFNLSVLAKALADEKPHLTLQTSFDRDGNPKGQLSGANFPSNLSIPLQSSNDLQNWQSHTYAKTDKNGDIMPLTINYDENKTGFIRGSSIDPVVREYQMGFTTWPYEATLDAINNNGLFISQNSDIISYHFQGGIPYIHADRPTPKTLLEYPDFVQNHVNLQIRSTNPRKTYLAVDPINSLRNGIALNWNENGMMQPRTDKWENIRFNDLEFINAYLNFARMLIDEFEPDYFNFGTEATDLALASTEKFDDFIEFWGYTYTVLKSEYPDLKLMVSAALKSPDTTEMQTVGTIMNLMEDYVDMYGISTYPYAFYNHEDRGNPDTLPADWLTQVLQYTAAPLAITETSWPAENINIQNDFDLQVTSTPEDQYKYIRELFEEVNRINAAFVIWFTAADYDRLGQTSDLSKIWEDTGILDQNLVARPAYTEWNRLQQQPFTPQN